ncbi:MAG: hypothetical protein ACYCVZ_08510 [Streptosporangiaceae bacterium]
MTECSVIHDTFSIERIYPAPGPVGVHLVAVHDPLIRHDLDGIDGPQASALREEGTAEMLDGLGRYLAAQTAG